MKVQHDVVCECECQCECECEDVHNEWGTQG